MNINVVLNMLMRVDIQLFNKKFAIKTYNIFILFGSYSFKATTVLSDCNFDIILILKILLRPDAVNIFLV